MSAMRKTQAEIEAIIATARAQAEPYIQIMNEVTKFSVPTIIIDADKKMRVLFSHETSMVYLIAKDAAENIFERAEKEINE